MQEIIITKNEAGQRFDKLLAKYLNKAPKSFLYKMLRKKNIELNGKKATGNEKLMEGDKIRLFLSDETVAKFSAGYGAVEETRTETKLSILYEDDDILLIDKPAGMLSQKAKDSDVSLVEHLIAYLMESGQLSGEELRTFRPSVCNRLDRNTSGLVVAGKSLPGLQTMGALFKDRTLHKYYRCLVQGNLDRTQHLKGWLAKDARTNKVRITGTRTPDAQFIETRYTPVSSANGVTLLEVELITGKTHQIRAHLASVGCPIIGDYKYGNASVNDRYKKEFGLSSQLLHAYRIEFPEEMDVCGQLAGKVFTAELPESFRKICAARSVVLED